MACIDCPYIENYSLIWRSGADPELICVFLWCCAGPELQVRRGKEVIANEYYATKSMVYERAEELRGEFLSADL